MRTLVFTSLPTGIGIGMLEVGIPAFSRAEGAAAAAGVLLAIWSFGSGDRRAALRHAAAPRAACTARTCSSPALLPLTLLPLAAAPSVWVMALLVIPAGCCIAPLLATRNELVGGVAPPGHAHRGLHVADHRLRRRDRGRARRCRGALVEGPGWRTAFLVAAAFAAVGALLAVRLAPDGRSRVAT